MNRGRNPALRRRSISAARGSHHDEQRGAHHTRYTESGRHAPKLLRQTVERQCATMRGLFSVRLMLLTGASILLTMSAGNLQRLRSGWPLAGVLLVFVVGLAVAGVGRGG